MTMRITEMLDYEFAAIERRCALLERENDELRRENCELLGKYISALDTGYTRMVKALCGLPVVESPDSERGRDG